MIVVNSNSYTLIERKTLQIALIVLYASVDIKPCNKKVKICIHVLK